MATPSTVATWTLNGSATEFDVPFDYLSRTFVKVTLIGATSTVLTLGTDYQFITPTRIQTFAAYGPPAYSLIEIRRETSTTDRLVEFHDASILTASDMNTADLQVLHVAEEARNAATETIGVNNDGELDARGRRIVNVAAPRPGTADAVNMAFYESDINGANAARVAAEAARDKANEWAVKPTPVEAGKESAKTYAERAGVSESTASTAAAAAVAARDQAVPAATTATEKAAEAAASADTATTKAAEAASSAAAAATFDPAKFVPQTSPTGHATLPTSSGATGQAAGLRYNNVKNRVEFWNGTAWAGLGGGVGLFDYHWHNGPRSEVIGGRIACDGQQLTQLMYPEAYAAVMAGKQSNVAEAAWLADPSKRNCWSTGGSGWVRVPDLNGAFNDGTNQQTGKPFYLRGSPTGLNGTSVLDAMQQHGHRVSGSNINQGNTTGYHIALVYTPNASGDKTGLNNYGTVVYRDDFVTDVVNGRTADETRVKTAYGVWTVTVATEVVNSGSVDILAVASRVDSNTTRITSLEARATAQESRVAVLYPGGTSATPASIGPGQRIEVDNPFPGHFVLCQMEVRLPSGKWTTSESWYSGSGTGGYGFKAWWFDGKIAVQTASTALVTASNVVLNPSGYTGATIAGALPYRLIVTSQGQIA